MSEQISNLDIYDKNLYFNRELSLLEFNHRVLLEAANENHPLLERLKFLVIFSSNLDEFFMIRVAGLKSQVAANVMDLSYDGQTPSEQLSSIRKKLLPLYKIQEKLLVRDVLPALRKNNVFIMRPSELTKRDKLFLEKYFFSKILPVLTPISIDPSHPFPRLINRVLHIVFYLKNTKAKNSPRKMVILQAPPILPRLIRMENKSGYRFVLLEQVIKDFAEFLFPGMEVESANTFRITRDADIEIAEDEAEDLLSEIEEQVRLRRWGKAAVRLEISGRMPEEIATYLREYLALQPEDVYIHNRPLHLSDFMKLMKLDLHELKDKTFSTRTIPEFVGDDVELFPLIAKKDFMVHHPFDSFTNSTLKFISQAANDPNVVAIKITLYRTGENTLLINSLKKASEAGKSVTAFVELKARFDEENNIIWAKELEQAGVNVIYGVLGLKTHCKISVVVRNEEDKMRSYLHLSTGNYNHSTARLYTDLAIFTANEKFGQDAVNLFNYLTGYSNFADWNYFSVAPVGLANKIISMIEREIELHTPENPGEINVKMNSLVQREVIIALYRASQKGVKIKLMVRGVCSLRPNLPGISENIEVRSIIGRFLEHTRVFIFKNAGKKEYYLSSADWMSRNLHRRVEIMFPVLQKNLQKRLDNLFKIYWKDNVKAWRLQPSGEYHKIQPNSGEKEFNSQAFLLEETKELRDARK